MNQEQAHRPNNPTGPSCGDGDGDANEKLEAVRKEAASIRDITKSHFAKAKSADSTTYLEQRRQRSGQ